MERKALVRLWDGAWQQGLWAAVWSKVLDGLTASQAAWKPHPGRHSIWQITHHVLFWREATLRASRGEPEPDEAEIRSRRRQARRHGTGPRSASKHRTERWWRLMPESSLYYEKFTRIGHQFNRVVNTLTIA